MSKSLKELFSAPTGELKPVTLIFGRPVFTSENLKKKFLLAMQKTGKISPISNTLEKLISNETLIPVYSTDKLISSIMRRQPVQMKGIAGLMSPQDKKIYIFVEDDANIFAFTSNNAIANVTIHELIHFFSFFHSREFYNIFKDDLAKFYIFYFTRIFNCDISKINIKSINQITQFINFKLEVAGLNFSNNLLKQYHQLLIDIFKPHSNYGDKEFTERVNMVIVLVKIVQKLITSGGAQYIEKTVDRFDSITSPLYVAYKYSFGINPMTAKTLCFQELFSTSEVIAIPAMVKTPNQNVYKALGKL